MVNMIDDFKNGISIVICCYNSELRLPETIEYLSKQILPVDFKWEIIVVDNNSKDRTLEFAQTELNRYDSTRIRSKVIRESQAGLSFARQCGIKDSKFEYVLFCDDDNWLSPLYLAKAFKIMEDNKKIGVLGGTGYPHFESKSKPAWFDTYTQIYALGDQGLSSGDVTAEKGYVYGAGMLIRKTALESININDSILLDRVGKKLSSGGDIELCLKIVCNGYQVWWEKELGFEHFIPDSRLSLTYVRKFFNDTVGTNLMLHGLMFKANINPSIFNTKWKRIWFIRLLYQLYSFRRPFDKKYLGLFYNIRLKVKEIVFLVEMNSKYDKLFN